MMPFEFISPLDLTEAAENGAAAGRKFVAGGTTLIDLMKLHVERPSHLIDLTPLVRRDASLGTVSDLPGGGLRLGALAHMSDVA
jgi:xanthine dehydrogenase YagS FAD-binding subunit